MTKDLIVKPNSFGNLYEVSFDGGGEVPQVLTGRYTSKVEAQKAINAYLHKRDAGKASDTTNQKTSRAK